jgi:hypothetical protein
LLDDEGALSEKLESVLCAIFCKYATHPSKSGTVTAAQDGHDNCDLAGWRIEPEGLARFGIDTNGRGCLHNGLTAAYTDEYMHIQLSHASRSGKLQGHLSPARF